MKSPNALQKVRVQNDALEYAQNTHNAPVCLYGTGREKKKYPKGSSVGVSVGT